MSLQFVGARPAPRVTGLERLPRSTSYYVGKDPSRWRTGVPSYARVKMERLYDGVDLVLYGDRGELEYDFVVAPGADPRQIGLRVSAEAPARIDARGDLIIETAAGPLVHRRPVAYQQGPLGRVPVAGRFAARTDGVIGFELGAYDRQRPLIIDPVLVFSHRVQDTGHETWRDVVPDAFGNAYLAGEVPDFSGFTDVHIARHSPGGGVSLSMLFGGSNTDTPAALALGPSNRIYVVGTTMSQDLPIHNGFEPRPNGSWESFLVAIDGLNVVYSTYFGAQSQTNGFYDDLNVNDVAVKGHNEVWMVGATTARQLSFAPNGHQRTNAGGWDAFVMKVDTTVAPASQVRFFTYYGGASTDFGESVALVPGQTGVVAAGWSGSSNLRVGSRIGPGSGSNGTTDAFVLRSTGSPSTFDGAVLVGGTQGDYPGSIAVDAARNIYFAGYTSSRDYPTTPGVSQRTYGGGIHDFFVTKLNPSASSIVYSTYLGGSGEELWPAIAVSAGGVVYLTGRTDSANFPVTAGAAQTTPGGSEDSVFVKLSVVGARGYSSYLGGNSFDSGEGVAVSGMNRYVVSQSSSSTFPGSTQPGDFTTDGVFSRFQASALLVVGNETLNAGDRAISNRLSGLGLAVTVKNAAAASATDAAAADLVFISASVTSADVNTKFKDSVTPVIVCEPAVQDDMAMTSTSSADYGDATGQTTLTMLAPSDPLGGGLSGSRVVTSAGKNFVWGKPAASAVRVAHLAGDSSRIAIYRYEAGATMAGGFVAPERRIMLFTGDAPATGDEAADSLTGDGAILFDAAVRWALGM